MTIKDFITLVLSRVGLGTVQEQMPAPPEVAAKPQFLNAPLIATELPVKLFAQGAPPPDNAISLLAPDTTTVRNVNDGGLSKIVSGGPNFTSTSLYQMLPTTVSRSFAPPMPAPTTLNTRTTPVIPAKPAGKVVVPTVRGTAVQGISRALSLPVSPIPYAPQSS